MVKFTEKYVTDNELLKTAEKMKAGYIWRTVSAGESAIVKSEKTAY